MIRLRNAMQSRSLRHILLSALALGFLLLTAAQYFLTGNFVAHQLIEIETRDAFSRMRSLHHAFDVAKEDLAVTTSDWAQWDSTYAYVTGSHPHFADENLYPATFARLRLSLVVLLDQHGALLFAKVVDGNGGLTDAPADILAALRADGPLHRDLGPSQPRTGLLESVSGVYLVSSQPTLNSAGNAAPRGRLIMGRELRTLLLPTLERMTGEKLDVARAQHAAPADQSVMRRGDDALLVGDDEMIGWAQLHDFWNRPVAQLQAAMQRPMQRIVIETRGYLLLATLLVGTLFCAAGLALIRRKVVAPLERLATAVETVGGEGRGGARVPVEGGTREFRTLSSAINAMLDQLEQQQAIQRDRDAALEANRLKSEFLATMSHEIRTPMNGVLGMCELLQRTDLDARQRHLSGTILRSARSLLDILNDILDFSKIESGRLELDHVPFSPLELVQAVSAPFMTAAQEKGIDFVVHIEAGVPPLTMGDPLRLRQVLGNLLSNALKFTSKGSIRVGCAAAETRSDQVELRFTVADTGIGVPAAAQQRIFEPFAQAEAGTSRRYGGTGLGLAIVRRLVELMGGRVQLQSEPGQGSIFTFTAVLKRAPEEVSARLALHDATGPRFSIAHAPSVLLAEDNAVNREVLTEMLEHFGCRVTAVENGAMAVAAARRTHFDVVLMDCQMPVMDGHAAAAQLRELERSERRVRAQIIALTADATAENRRRCTEVGMDAVATKPISHGALRNLIFQAVRLRASDAPQLDSTESVPG